MPTTSSGEPLDWGLTAGVEYQLSKSPGTRVRCDRSKPSGPRWMPFGLVSEVAVPGAPRRRVSRRPRGLERARTPKGAGTYCSATGLGREARKPADDGPAPVTPNGSRLSASDQGPFAATSIGQKSHRGVHQVAYVRWIDPHPSGQLHSSPTRPRLTSYGGRSAAHADEGSPLISQRGVSACLGRRSAGSWGVRRAGP